MTPELRLTLEHADASYRPGEEIRGKVEWHIDGPPRSVEVRLLWMTRGRGVTDREVVARFPFDHPRAHDGREFKLLAPCSPYSFFGSLVSLVWVVELAVSPGDLVERYEFVISPSGSEFRLHPRAIDAG